MFDCDPGVYYLRMAGTKVLNNLIIILIVASLRCVAPDDMNPLYTENWTLDDVDYAIYLGCGKDRCTACSRCAYRKAAGLVCNTSMCVSASTRDATRAQLLAWPGWGPSGGGGLRPTVSDA